MPFLEHFLILWNKIFSHWNSRFMRDNASYIEGIIYKMRPVDYNCSQWNTYTQGLENLFFLLCINISEKHII